MLHKTHAQPCEPKLGCQSVLAQHQMRGFIGSDATASILSQQQEGWNETKSYARRDSHRGVSDTWM
jgi:hypothetical protein